MHAHQPLTHTAAALTRKTNMNRSKLLLIGLTAVCLAADHSAASDTFPGAAWQRVPSVAAAGWNANRLNAARQYAESIDTAAVMVIHHGRVITEWGPTALPLKCHSIRKSLLSALFGPAVSAGLIDLDRTLADSGIDDKAPSLTNAEAQARIRDLLAARSGVYHPALYETAKMAARRPQRGSHAPNTFWYYNNWDFNALGSIFENATGRSVFEDFQRRIAEPLQLQDFIRSRHTAYVTGKDSVHPAYPFQLSARDLARIGLLCLHHGRWRDQQIIPAAWIQQSTQAYSDAGESGGYGYMWWVASRGKHLPGVQIPDGSYSARGYRGHYLLVIPEWDIVIVHRVNTFQQGRTVSRSQFGKLTEMILSARPSSEDQPQAPPLPTHARFRPGTANSSADSAPVPFDLVLLGGRLIDGSGEPARQADIGIRQGRIAAIGDLAQHPAHQQLNVSNHIVAPGFIDMHSHADRGLVDTDAWRRAAPNLITQGITTVVVNQDGSGAPSIRAQRQTMQRLGIGLNVIQMIGHGTLRRRVMGNDFRRPATPQEIAGMQQHLRAALQQGARGMSAGLEYVPGRWSTPREMEALAGELTSHRGVYIVHERSSGSRPMWYLPSRDDPQQPSMIDNLQELIRIADATRVPVVATHIKARGVDFWGSSKRMIAMIDQARSEGIPLYADQYPYNTSGSDGRIVLIPSWVSQYQPSPKSTSTNATATARQSPAEQLERVLSNTSRAADVRKDIAHEILRRGGGQKLFVMEHPNESYIGKSLAALAQQEKCDAVQMAIQLQLQGDRNRPGGARLRAYSMSQSDVDAFAQTAWTATSSDAGIALPEDGPVHPRFYGSFPRKIRRYAIENNWLSLEEAVRVCTALPAQILGISDRGRITRGYHADLVVFHPQQIRDRADAFHPHRYSTGIPYVLVGGELAVDQGSKTGKLAGQVVR